MLQFVKVYFGFFDPSTSVPGSLSLRLRSNVLGNEGPATIHNALIVLVRAKQTDLPGVKTTPGVLLPKHHFDDYLLTWNLNTPKAVILDINNR